MNIDMYCCFCLHAFTHKLICIMMINKIIQFKVYIDRELSCEMIYPFNDLVILFWRNQVWSINYRRRYTVIGWCCSLWFKISLIAPISVYRDKLLIPQYKDTASFLWSHGSHCAPEQNSSRWYGWSFRTDR